MNDKIEKAIELLARLERASLDYHDALSAMAGELEDEFEVEADAIHYDLEKLVERASDAVLARGHRGREARLSGLIEEFRVELKASIARRKEEHELEINDALALHVCICCGKSVPTESWLVCGCCDAPVCSGQCLGDHLFHVHPKQQDRAGVRVGGGRPC